MAEKTFHSITLPGQDTARVPLTAAEFSTSVAYKVKDYCTHQGKLYRCTTAHAAGAWNAAHFTATDVDAEFDRKLDIPASQASAPANPRVGDLWIDNDENSPIYNVDASPTLNSTNAVQSGGTKTALNSLDSRKMEHGVITGDFSESVDYRVGDLVFYATTANGITTRTLYRCTTDHNAAAWNAAHFTATTLEVELQKIRESEADTDMIGDLFGAKPTYAVGDYCVYNDNLYRCIRAVDNSSTSTPAFNLNDWTQVRLANDVSDLNSALNDVVEEIGMYIPPSSSGTTLATSQFQILINPVSIVSGHSYTYSIEFAAALSVVTYVYVVKQDGTTINSFNIDAGETSGQKTFLSNVTDNAAYVRIATGGYAVTYSVQIIDNSVSHDSRIDTLEDDVDELEDSLDATNSRIDTLNSEIGFPINETYTGQLQASSSLIIISKSAISLTGGHTYTLTLTLGSASDNPVYFYFRDSANTTSLKSTTLNAGSLSKSVSYTPDSDIDVLIGVNDGNRVISYTATLVDSNQNSRIDYIDVDIDSVKSEILELKQFTGDTVPISFAANKYILTPSAGIYVDLTPATNTGDTCASVTCKKGDVFTLTGTCIGRNSGKRPYMWVNSSLKCVYREDNIFSFDSTVIKAPVDGYLVVNFLMSEAHSLYKGYRGLEDKITDIVRFIGENEPVPLVKDTYIATPSVGSTATYERNPLNGCASAVISCSAGDMFTLFGTPRANSGTRAYAWINSSNKCVFRYDDINVMEDVLITAPYNGTLIVNLVTSAPYAVYKGIYDCNSRIAQNIRDIRDLYKIKTSPIESLPVYIRNDLSYRPLGQLSKGYLCLVCDDGTAGLGSYTIPMLTQKNVPCTFALWSTSYRNDLERRSWSPSVILQTPEGVQQVLDAISDLGCSVAQHGHEYWTDLTEQQLNDFFSSEKEEFESLGINIEGAVYPGHCVNNRIRPIVGGLFNSVRSGYKGHLSKQDMLDGIPGDVFTPYGTYTGARSNCYSYTSFNIIDSDKDINTLKSMLDNAIANNLVMITHWHDWNFIDSDADYLANRTKLEAFIDYAKTTSITFCTLGEIPTLI